MNALVRALLAGAALFPACAPDATPSTAVADAGLEPSSVEESASAAARVDEVRARFWVERTPALGPVHATTRFEASPGAREATHIRAVVPGAAAERSIVHANVDLPRHADGQAHVEDSRSRVGVGFRLRGASTASVSVAGGYALYPAALGGADIVHRVLAEGTEDYVVFEKRPSREELVYDVDVSRVAGLRLVSDTLEFLDERGSPALRLAPPYVVDAAGARRAANIAVTGCAYEPNGAAPSGRPVVRPGAERCAVHVTWRDVTYPALVDPAWTGTGSMATPRWFHTASLLRSGKVLVAGGEDASSTPVRSAEIFDPAGNGGAGAFVATGSMATARSVHTAAVLPSGRVLVAGGASDASAEIFDPAANAGVGAFVATGSMSAPRSYHAAATLASGKVLIVGGKYVGTAEIFDPAANGGVGAFSPTGAMGIPRASHTASLLLSGKVLVAGGFTSASLGAQGSAEIFDPAANGGIGAFAGTGAMTTTHAEHTATVLASGKVLVVGGQLGDAVHFFTGADLFDPNANGGAGAFSGAGDMLTARASHTASLLPSGMVLVAGGRSKYPTGSMGTPIALAELFDPTANGGKGGFGVTTSMATARAWHTATALASGLVLATGGDSTGGTISPGAELYGGLQGEPCVSGCLSGYCVDGVCCNTACAGSCDRCNVSGKEGTCTVVPLGDPGVGPACAPFVCDGASAACPATCASDATCAHGSYCGPDGACHASKGQGSACNPQTDCKTAGCAECASGHCVDGVCCDTACNGTCEACAASLKESKAADGTCGPIRDGTDPRNECAHGATICGPDGMCNGAGGCRFFASAGVSCGAGTCQGTVAQGQLCDGAGTCASNGAGIDCSPFRCANGGCTTTCTDSSECAADGWCSAGRCEKRSANGAACTAGETCSSGICADGVCCNTACTGQCEACDVKGAEGTCTAVSGAPHAPRPACATGDVSNPCAAAVCDGNERGTCAGFVGPSVACGAPSCTGGHATQAGTCDHGGCQTPQPTPCGSYACGATACNTSCAKDPDCAPGNRCNTATSKCVSGAVCDGDHTATKTDGTTQDCAPYKCDSDGSCRAQCTSVADCVAPAVCDGTGKCVPPADSTGAGGGCSAARPSGVEQLAWPALALLALRRRRRARKG